jgi:GNAT superfamily N-acetyltransferase
VNAIDKSKVVIRKATAADAAALASLRYEFRCSLGPTCESKEAFVARCRLWMQTRLEASVTWHCWLVEIEQMPVGHVWVKLIEKIPNPAIEAEYHAYVTNFYVRDDSRGSGIGSMLLGAALTWIRERDVHAVILWPTKNSRSLYERHGFAVRDDLMELFLKEEVHW